MEKNTEILYKNMSIKSDHSEDEDKRQFSAIITDDSVDRDREVLLPSGMNKKDFVKNGIILFNHDPNQPVGTTLALRRSGNAWKATGMIAEGVQLAEDVWKLIKQGVLKGVSVGFQVEERRAPTAEDKKKFGKTVESVISKWKLLEFSIVSIGSNQNALITAAKKLNIDPKAFISEEIVSEEGEVEEKIEVIDGVKGIANIEVEIDVDLSLKIKEPETKLVSTIEETKEVSIEAEEKIEDKVEDIDFSKLMLLNNEIEDEIKALQADIKIDDETKKRLVEVAKAKKVDIKEVMSVFTAEIRKEIKKSRGILF